MNHARRERRLQRHRGREVLWPQSEDNAAAGPKRGDPGKESGAALGFQAGRMRAMAEAPQPQVSLDLDESPWGPGDKPLY